jgi:hypothetical protein
MNEYFAESENFVNNISFALKTQITKRKINEFLGIIEGQIHFTNGVLDFLEVIRIIKNKLEKKKYKYNFRDIKNELVFRYDNATHHLEVSTYPHHKHIKDEFSLKRYFPPFSALN